MQELTDDHHLSSRNRSFKVSRSTLAITCNRDDVSGTLLEVHDSSAAQQDSVMVLLLE